MSVRASKQYKCLPFLAAAFITISIFVHLFEQREVWLEVISIATFLSPFIFIVNDIIAEIYGYKISMRIFWASFFCHFVYFGVCILLINVSSPSNLSDQGGYSLLFKYIWHAIIINPFALLAAWWLNARLIIKWKILLKGKYFWLRSLGSSGIAETLFAVIAFLSPPYEMKVNKALEIMFWLIIFRLLFTAILAFPASLVVSMLKTIEQVDDYNIQNQFNPFKK